MSRYIALLSILFIMLSYSVVNGGIFEQRTIEDEIQISIEGSKNGVIEEDPPSFPGEDPFIESMSNEAKNENIYGYIDTLQNFEENGTPTRETGTTGFDDAVSWVYDKLETYGLEVYTQDFTFFGGDSTNVIAVLPGEDPELEPKTYIIGGHLDSINDWGDAAPGADDNGSGISLMLEAARIMSQYSFKRTVRFAAWGAEEQGLHGSEHYVNNIDPEVEDVQGYLNYDMIGYCDPDTLEMAHTLHANSESSWMLDYQSDVKDAYENPLDFTYEYDSSETRSDHASFWDGGYDAMLAIETEFSPYYHTEDDILDNLHVPMVTNLTKHSIATVAHLAEPVIEGDPPEIEVDSPDGGEVLSAGDLEDIQWTTEEGDDPVDHIDLCYSIDDGDSWETIDSNLPDTGAYEWEVPNENSVDCLVRVSATDIEGRIVEDESSDTFTIQGVPPSPPDNLDVEHHGESEVTLFEDDVSTDLGYTTGTSESVPEESEWQIRSNGAVVGDQSWDFGDGDYHKTGDHGYISRMTTPDIDIPKESDEVVLIFDHWRSFGDDSMYDGGNLKISTEGDDGPWELITPEEGYDGTIDDGYGNPLGGEEGWGYEVDWETATFDLTEYVGEMVNLRWETGIEAWDGFHGEGWRIDDIRITAEGIETDGDEHNLISWDASPGDPDEVSHYNIYRSEEHDGPWEEPIDSVDAHYSDSYEYVDYDKGMADDIYWWYVVRAVGENGMEEGNEDAVQEPGDELTTIDIDLFAEEDADGWNFVSFNLVLENNELAAILEDEDNGISGNYEKTMFYDPAAGGWQSYIPDRDDHFNEIETWYHTMGIWIRMNSDDTLTVEGQKPTETTITLNTGWNMVSYPSADPTEETLPAEVTTVGFFDETEDNNVAYVEVDEFQFEPGEGYYQFAEEETTWTVEY